jgi:hypothetical protein
MVCVWTTDGIVDLAGKARRSVSPDAWAELQS